MNIYTASLMALIAYGAQGDTAAVGANAENGIFHLTDEKVEGGYRAFCVNAKNIRQIIEGVWTWDDDGVIVKWMNGDTLHYIWDFWKPNQPVLKRIGLENAK